MKQKRRLNPSDNDEMTTTRHFLQVSEMTTRMGKWSVSVGQDVPNDQLSTLLAVVIRQDNMKDSEEFYSDRLLDLVESALRNRGDEELRNLIESHPEVKLDLQDGWRTHTFHKIRRSGALNSFTVSGHAS